MHRLRRISPAMPCRLAGLCFLLAGVAHAETLLLANVWDERRDPSGYWVSEKLDGVRAYWDGKVLYTRGNHRIHAPPWFTAGFPRRRLDGELWMGRGHFEQVSAIVRSQQASDADWQKVRYCIFELPDGEGDFTMRIMRIRELVRQANVPWLLAVEQFRIASTQALQQHLQQVVDAGGEGLMLHRAAAPYHGGRSDDLLKLKPSDDGEARVVAHIPGKGRNRGRMGAIEVEMESGLRFRIGSGFSDHEREKPPPIGSIVTYIHNGFTAAGIPRFARFLRLRDDF